MASGLARIIVGFVACYVLCRIRVSGGLFREQSSMFSRGCPVIEIAVAVNSVHPIFASPVIARTAQQANLRRSRTVRQASHPRPRVARGSSSFPIAGGRFARIFAVLRQPRFEFFDLRRQLPNLLDQRKQPPVQIVFPLAGKAREIQQLSHASRYTYCVHFVQRLQAE